ncbi:5'-AMP-activated protein kinase subunit beta-1 [Yarrowia sp. C11]|nr:5'-AMP-activated protein kinase subunit beta-1 [Yarrowia sp. C11]KAG5364832.1 5'-AMP-activated protein kinase subunit beta-1 [Yarrowia sp. E02]
MVQHTFEWPFGGSEVLVSGTFDNWSKSVKLDKTSTGFSKTVTLPKETTKYKFYVDGVWKVDVGAPTEKDGEGNLNNVLIFAEGDLHNHTQNIPGAFPGAADAPKETHDLKPSHLDPKAAHKLEDTLETKREAVAGGLVDPVADDNGYASGKASTSSKHVPTPSSHVGSSSSGIPLASTTSQNQPVTHDLKPSHLSTKQAEKIENVLEVKQEAVDGGLVEPIDATGQSRAVPSHDVTSTHAPPLSKFQKDEKDEFTTATLPAASTSHPEPITHDLKPSHLSHKAEHTLEQTLETKKEAVSGGLVIPTYAENPIPAASTTSQTQPREHDLQPSHLSHQAYDKLNSAVERKHDIIEDGKVSPVDSRGNSRAVPSMPLSQEKSNPATSGTASNQYSAGTTATIPKASTSHPEPVTHDLQPSHLSHKAEQTLEGVVETKREAVDGGLVIPTYAENPIPAASTTSQHQQRTHDLQPSHIGAKAEHALDDNLAFKQNAVEKGRVDPDKL